MTGLASAPGRDWLDVVSRTTLSDFSEAFSAEPELGASVLSTSILGAARIHAFFSATRAMYDRIAFTSETPVGDRSVLEWEGTYRGASVQGVTVLERDAGGAIARIRIFHLPYDQIVAFADDLSERLQITRL